jgi:hypothetical protein
MNPFLRIVSAGLIFGLSYSLLFSKDPVPSVTPVVSPTPPRINLCIYREYKSDSCISGYLAVENKVIAYTLERPDVANLNGFSAVKAGVYPAHLRYDKTDQWRIQLENVPNRTAVQIHIGNQVTDSGGCILVGLQLDADLCALSDSSGAYARLKKAFSAVLGETDLPKEVDIQVEIDDPPALGLAGTAAQKPDPDPSKDKAVQEAIQDFNGHGNGIDEEFRKGNAALVMGKLSPTPETAGLLLNQIGKEVHSILRGKMIEALGEMGTADPAILPLLIQLAGKGKDDEKSFALKGLGAMGPDAQPAIGVIKKNLRNQDYFIRQNAKWALARVKGTAGNQTGKMPETK